MSRFWVSPNLGKYLGNTEKCLRHLKIIAAGIYKGSQVLKICNPNIVEILLFQQNFILRALLVPVLVLFRKNIKSAS